MCCSVLSLHNIVIFGGKEEAEGGEEEVESGKKV